jgi:murein DD-endopeptidase MepM/ murein hydrolase activator NlpD
VLRNRSRLRARTPAGFVGDTGRAHGCRLHLEVWSTPDRRAGGAPLDPLRSLGRGDNRAG